MWKVGTLVQPGLSQRIFLTISSPKGNFKCQFSDAFFKEGALQYGLSLCIV